MHTHSGAARIDYRQYMPAPADLFAMIAFGAIGAAAILYGKRTSNMKTLGFGFALCGYPYLVNSTLLLYVIGLALTAGLFVLRD